MLAPARRPMPERPRLQRQSRPRQRRRHQLPSSHPLLRTPRHCRRPPLLPQSRRWSVPCRPGRHCLPRPNQHPLWQPGLQRSPAQRPPSALCQRRHGRRRRVRGQPDQQRRGQRQRPRRFPKPSHRAQPRTCSRLDRHTRHPRPGLPAPTNPRALREVHARKELEFHQRGACPFALTVRRTSEAGQSPTTPINPRASTPRAFPT